MIEPAGPTLSALAGFQKKLNVTSNNVANVNTDGFKKSRVAFQEGLGGGIQPVVDQVTTPGYPKEVIDQGGVSTVASSNVDLAEELPEMLSTKSAYNANLKTLKVKDDMIGSMLDIIS